MKKLISLTIVAVMLLTLLVACQPTNDNGNLNSEPSTTGVSTPSFPDSGNVGPSVPSQTETLKGSEAAKLLLAEERLNSQLLQNEGDIFENGSDVFYNLAAIAKENLVKYTYEGNKITNLSFDANGYINATPLVSSNNGKEAQLSSTLESTDGSVLEIDGDVYKWSNFAEYSNSYDYFTNLTTNVVLTAESAAKQIDNTKKYVRIVDKWVDVGGVRYYLHVEDNCEILYELNGEFLSICKRSKNEQGINVYEIYTSSSSGQMRMTYIQGCKYEYTYQATDDFNHNFIAENTKGFWEVLDVSRMDTHYNVSCMVVKDDICYDAFYEPKEGMRGLSLLKVISADKKTDIVFFSGNGAHIEVSLQAFDGVKYIQIEAPAENVTSNAEHQDGDILFYLDQGGQRYYSTTGRESAEVVLENGMVLRNGDSFFDGKVQVGRTLVSFFNKEGGTCGYMPQLQLSIMADSYAERMQILDDFLELTGLTCRRDMDYVQAGILQAYEELDQFVQYHTWNESPIKTEEDLAKGFENLDAKYKAWRDLYDTVKDGEVIDFSDKETVELNINFAPITAQQAVSVKNEGLQITVTDLSLTVEDTTLLVENEPYMINFALLGKSSPGLTHVAVEGTQTGEYAGGESFTVTQNATFTVPALSFDEYTVVSYISTTDGIRMSGYTALVFTEVVDFEEKQGNIAITISQGSEGELIVLCERILDIEVVLMFDTADVYYMDMYEALSVAAYQYGYAAEGAKLEILLEDGTWIELENETKEPEPEEDVEAESEEEGEPTQPEGEETEEQTALESGTYRLKYEIKNGDTLIEGYVFTQYTKQ